MQMKTEFIFLLMAFQISVKIWTRYCRDNQQFGEEKKLDPYSSCFKNKLQREEIGKGKR